MTAAFDDRLQELDLSLLSSIESQTTEFDRRSLLALHLACRRAHAEFTWLEIGSHLGGSLQTLVRDPACTRIDSIDPRPRAQDDERGEHYAYPGNSTERMLGLLGGLDGADVAKLHTHEASTGEIDPAALPRPQVCFIDGEHTDRAAAADARFCRAVLRDQGLIVFHDVGIVYRAVRAFVDGVRAEGVPTELAYLPDSLFAVELGASRILAHEAVTRQRLEAHWGALWLLDSNDPFRRALDRPVLRTLRRLGWLRVDEA
jgi:hypothetical protein